MKALRTPDERFDELDGYPFAPNYAEVPAAFADKISLEDHHRAADYSCAKIGVGRISLAWETLWLLLWTIGGGINLIDQWWLDYVQRMTPDAAADKQIWASARWTWGTDQTFPEAVEILRTDYLEVRRQHLYVNHSINVNQEEVTVLLPEFSMSSYFVPSDDSLGTTWTELGFDDAAWSSCCGVARPSLASIFVRSYSRLAAASWFFIRSIRAASVWASTCMTIAPFLTGLPSVRGDASTRPGASAATVTSCRGSTTPDTSTRSVKSRAATTIPPTVCAKAGERSRAAVSR